MKNRLPIAVSVTALVVALLGATGAAEAVISFAANAGKLNGYKASKVKKKNTVVVRGVNGLIDRASIPPQARGAKGATGPTGPPGAQGPSGAQGPAGAPNPNAVDSDKIDGYHANELVRAEESTFSGNMTLTSTDGDVLLSVVINAPRAGYLVATGSGTYTLVQGGYGARCGLDVDTPDGSSTWASNYHSSALVTNTGTSFAGQETCSVTRRFSVTGGLLHTVRYKARAEFTSNATALGGQLTVFFVPFGPNGE